MKLKIPILLVLLGNLLSKGPLLCPWKGGSNDDEEGDEGGEGKETSV